MNENKERKWHGAVAVLAFLAIFYVGGQFENGSITAVQFCIKFALLTFSLAWNLNALGFFENEKP